MITFQVKDYNFKLISNEQYDVSIFASGYEERCVFIPKKINKNNISNHLVLGFTEESESVNRPKNDKYFQENWGFDPSSLSSDDDKLIYDYLNNCFQEITEKPIRILIDYSSMSRLWYATVLNWARIISKEKEIIIDFIYAIGTYQKERKPMVIRHWASIPGCEGRAFRQGESTAVFGLGFHGLAALCVFDQLESDTVYSFLASPSKYSSKTKKLNKYLIENPKMKAVLELPLNSLENCYRSLAEIISPHRPDGEITLVPMGPKPHVLASILVAMRFQEVACLRVSGKNEPLDVTATGEIISTRVIIKK